MANSWNICSSIIILRLVQGLFAGGEWASGSVITMETVPKKVRGFFSGFVLSGYSFGFVIASVVYTLMLNIFPGQEFIDIGWRFLFFTALLPGLVALIIRVKITESKIWVESKQRQIVIKNDIKNKMVYKSSIKTLMSDKVQRKRIFLALIIMMGLYQLAYIF